jgi:hypothetical protein
MIHTSYSPRGKTAVFFEWARSAMDASETLPELQASPEMKEEFLRSTLSSMCSIIDSMEGNDQFDLLRHHIDYSLHRIDPDGHMSDSGEAGLMAATLGVTAISGPCSVPLNKWAREALKRNEYYCSEQRESEFLSSFLHENLVMMSHYAAHTGRKDVVRSINRNIAHIDEAGNMVEGYRKCIAAVMAMTGACSLPLVS